MATFGGFYLTNLASFSAYFGQFSMDLGKMSLLQGDKTKKTSPSGHTDNSDWHCVILTLFVQGKVTAPAAHITLGRQIINI